MIPNKKLMEMAKSTMDAAAVTLSIEEADQFLDDVFDQSSLKNNAQIVRMNRPDKYINQITYKSGNFLIPSGQFSSTYYKSTFDVDQIQLTTKKLRGCAVVTDDDKDDVMPGTDWTDVVLKLVAARIANQLEEIAWISDTQSLGGFAATDPRSLFDGWRYRINNSQSGDTYESNAFGSAVILDAALNSPNTSDFRTAGKISEYDASGTPPWEHKYQVMQQNIPSEYFTVAMQDWRLLNHTKVSLDYQAGLSDRQTTLGDQAITGVPNLYFNRVPVVDAPLMSTTLDSSGVHGNGSYTDSLLTPKNNLVLGIQRDLRLEKYRDTPNSRDLWFFDIRLDLAVNNVHACILTKNLTTTV